MALQEAHGDFGGASGCARSPGHGGLWRLAAAIALNIVVGYGIVAAFGGANLPGAGVAGEEWHGNVAHSAGGR